jgi:hypothetical protein
VGHDRPQLIRRKLLGYPVRQQQERPKNAKHTRFDTLI